jgi:hypothetical protein
MDAALVSARKALTLNDLYSRKSMMDVSAGTAAGDWARAIAGNLDGQLTAEGAWNRQGWYRRCIDVRAKGVAEMPFTITGRGGTWDAEMDRTPPAGMEAFKNLRGLLYRFEGALITAGAAMALKEREGGRFRGLRYWRPGTVEIKYDGGVSEPYPGIGRFKRTVRPEGEWFDPEDVLAVFQPDWNTEAGPGASDGQAARIHADVLDSLDRFLDGHIDRDLIKATVLTTERNPTPEQKAELQGFWRRTFGTFGGRRRRDTAPPVISDKFTPYTIGDGLKDLDNEPLTRAQREGLATSFGVPHSVVMSNAASYATANVDLLVFYLFTAIPQALLIADALNEHVLGPEGLEMEMQPYRLEVMQAYELQKAAQVKDLADILTVDERRELMDYKRLKRAAGATLGKMPTQDDTPPSVSGDGQAGAPPTMQPVPREPGKALEVRLRERVEEIMGAGL